MVAGRDDLVERFLAAIDTELAPLDRPAVETVFIGGGTPTHLSPDQLGRLLRCVADRFDVSGCTEWSVEANPEDIDETKLALLRDGGVNRISLGVQSFNDDKLTMLERGHDRDAAETVIALAASVIDNVSIDLIFAAPGETLDDWNTDLQTALAAPISHLSTYALTFEKGTAFWSRRRSGDLSAAAESLEVDMYNLTRDQTAAHGLQHYEVSNFALPTAKCRHNLAYWEGKGWFAAGPGAARFVGGDRQVNHRSTTTYLKRIESSQSPTAETEAISVEQYARERAAFGIRMLDGIDLDALSMETGFDLRAACEAATAKLLDDGLLTQTVGRVKLTERGILFADSVAAEFLG